MGLDVDSLVDDVKEEVNKLDKEDYDELSEKIALYHASLIAMDKAVEDACQKISLLERRIEDLEEQVDSSGDKDGDNSWEL